jgi:uncharacterized protein YfaS (alpha-2-macroglobulin family)
MKRSKKILSCSLLFNLLFSTLLVTPLQIHAATQVAEEKQGLQFRLSNAGQPAQPKSTTEPAAAELSVAETRRLLSRLPAMPQEEAQPFALRESTAPPPQTGNIITTPFPAAETVEPPAVTTSDKLDVLRFAPEGEVTLAQPLSVTFSQPMVAVASAGEAVTENLPVRLTPQPEGKWRWVGTKTLLFEPTGRFPMATAYKVEIPAGTKSATGASLSVSKNWTFATPAPLVKSTYPNDKQAQPRQPLLFVEFDQFINPQDVTQSIRIQAGAQSFRARLATRDEIEADNEVKALVDTAHENYWLAFRAVNETSQTDALLPANATVTVSFPAGTPSAEGARTTDRAQQFTFKTHDTLRVTNHECDGERGCSPFDSWTIAFNNPLDEDAFKPSQVRVTPAIPGLEVEAEHERLTITGSKRSNTRYTVTLDAAIKDRFEQTLGKNVTLTFNVKASRPYLSSDNNGFFTLDPASLPYYSIYSANYKTLRVRLYAAEPERMRRFLYPEADEVDRSGNAQFGKLVLSKIINVSARPDEVVETLIDLRPALKGKFGHVAVDVEPLDKRRNINDEVRAWIQVTNLALDAFTDKSELVAWATSLKDGAPVAGARLSSFPNGIEASTDAEGVARVALQAYEKEEKAPKFLLVRKGEDVAILSKATYYGDKRNWAAKPVEDTLRWYVFDDRGMYRPDEEVHVKGWLRRIGGKAAGDVAMFNEASSIAYSVKDWQNTEVVKGVCELSAFGGFDMAFKLPKTMNLGYARVELKVNSTLQGAISSHRFQVQEFRRPEFEVSASTDGTIPMVGKSSVVTVNANYFAGGGLPDAEVNWQVTARRAQFTPPNRDDFTFGKWQSWWGDHDSYDEPQTQRFKSQTDAAGKHRLKIDFDRADPPYPYSLNVEAGVMDVNRQRWNAKTTLLVHPAELYVGLKSENTFVQPGEPLTVQTIVTDLDGNAVANRQIKVQLIFIEWVYEKREWQKRERVVQERMCTSASDATTCELNAKEGGAYRVIARVEDERDRPSESELRLWVAGGSSEPQTDIEKEDVQLIPKRRAYAAGDTAEILVQAPFYPAEGLLTLRRSGIVRAERFKMNEASYVLRVPISESFYPNVSLQVDLVGATTRTDEAGKPLDKRLPKRPAYASGELKLPVPPMQRKLAVKAVPQVKTLEPRGETEIDVEVRDAANHAVAASEVAVVVVDEAILALTGYKLDDPLDLFYANRNAEVDEDYARSHVQLASPEMLLRKIQKPGIITIGHGGGTGGGDFREGGVAGGIAGGVPGGVVGGIPVPMPPPPPAKIVEMVPAKEPPKEIKSEDKPIEMRSNFNALALFAPIVKTDTAGRASVKVKLPDNLTRYRVMAVAVAGAKQFGLNEANITARLPLMVRPSAPRFLNFGDKCELPVIVQNQTDTPMEVNLAVRASNVELTAGGGRHLKVPANNRVEVRFPIAATRVGTARFQIAAASGEWADAAEIALPVWTPATTEAFATYGEIDAGSIVQPVKAPADSIKQFGGLEITASSTQLQTLTDAVLYLTSYPFECSEQLSSRILAVAALRDVLTAFKAEGLPQPDEMVAAVERDIKRLQTRHNSDGSFGLWKRGDKSYPYLSIHVAHALQRAKEKGFAVPADMLNRSRDYLRKIESSIPKEYSIKARRSLIAYALYVLNRMGEANPAKARALIAEAGLENLSIETLAWLLSVLAKDAGSASQVAAIQRFLNNRATEEAATAHFVTSYGGEAYLLLHSDRRTDAVVLEALINTQPQNDLIPKLVRGLLAHRRSGHWRNTQENAFVLLALDRYFQTYEKATPDFVARAWLGDKYAGDYQFSGRTTDRQNINVPMSYLIDRNAAQNLILNKQGTGRLYYRIGMRYAPASLQIAGADYGFTVERVYEAVDDASDVQHDGQGIWHIKAGARVRVRLTMVAPTTRYHVALVDPLPAGFEILNAALAVTESLPPDPRQTSQRYWQRTWYGHQNLRDDRVEAFASLVGEGVYTYTYYARATTPGQFIAPPVKAEEMYAPETFGRSASERVIVE